MSRAVLMLSAALLALPVSAQDIERNFAGSAQLDYLAVPTSFPARPLGLDGFTTELSIKLTVDFTDRLSASVKVCYGCHAFETDMAHVDLRVVDELNVRVGRINPSFGEFGLRHDPANHRASSKPLPYDMGRMLRRDEWNMSVLPSPYVDNGVELSGNHFFGESVAVDYAAFIVSGLKGSDDGSDLDFVQSRSGSLYYVDNNSEPAVGGRVALTVNVGDEVTATLGGSGMYGHYDPSAALEYWILGADAYLRLGQLTLRGEYLVRRTEFALGTRPDQRFRYAFTDPSKNFFVKDGFYVEAEYPIVPSFEVLARFDGLRRVGNVLASSSLRSDSAVLRTTVGVNFVIYQGLRLKLSGELWDFSDFDDEVALHAGVVASF